MDSSDIRQTLNLGLSVAWLEIPQAMSPFLCPHSRATISEIDFIGLSSEKTYGDAHSKRGKVSNLVNGPIPWNAPPSIGKILKFISEFRIKSCGMDFPISNISWKFLKFYFSMYCPMMHANLP